MKRFRFDNDDEEEENEEEENDKFINSEFFSMAPFPLGSESSILSLSIKICEKLFFWKFYSLKIKLEKIKETYKSLKELEEEENI